MTDRLPTGRFTGPKLWLLLPCISLVILTACKGDSDSSACDGEVVGGFCWYLGELDQSCNDVCDERGGFDDATTTWAGAREADDRSNIDICMLFAEAFGFEVFDDGDNIAGTDDFGCAATPSKNIARSNSSAASRAALKCQGRLSSTR